MAKPLLLVNDSDGSLTDLAAHLEIEGYQPTVILGNDDPVEQFEKLLPELIFISLLSPGALITCEGIREHLEGAIVPIIFVGDGNQEISTAAGALAHGGDFYLPLPLQVDKAVRKVLTYVGPGDSGSDDEADGGDTSIDLPAQKSISEQAEELAMEAKGFDDEDTSPTESDLFGDEDTSVGDGGSDENNNGGSDENNNGGSDENDNDADSEIADVQNDFNDVTVPNAKLPEFDFTEEEEEEEESDMGTASDDLLKQIAEAEEEAESQGVEEESKRLEAKRAAEAESQEVEEESKRLEAKRAAEAKAEAAAERELAKKQEAQKAKREEAEQELQKKSDDEEKLRKKIQDEIREKIALEEAQREIERAEEEKRQGEAKREEAERAAQEEIKRQAELEKAEEEKRLELAEQEAQEKFEREEAERAAQAEIENRIAEEKAEEQRKLELQAQEKLEEEEAQREAQEEIERQATVQEAEEQQQREQAERAAQEEIERQATAQEAEEQQQREQAERAAQEEIERQAAAQEAEKQQQREQAERAAQEEIERQAAAQEKTETELPQNHAETDAELRARIEAEVRERMRLEAEASSTAGNSTGPDGAPATSTTAEAKRPDPLPPARNLENETREQRRDQHRTARPPISQPTLLEGEFGEGADIATVIARMSMEQVTGRIDFRSELRNGTIFMIRGEAVAMESTQVFDRMEEYLYRTGKITRAQYNDIRVKRFDTSRQIAAHLVAEKFIKGNELFGVVRGHQEDVYYGLFELPEGSFHFYKEEVNEDDRVPLGKDPEAMITEAIRRKYLMPRLRALLGSSSSILTIPEGGAEPDYDRLDLSTDERQIAKFADGTRSIEDIIFSTGLESQEVYATLTALFCLGYMTISVRGIEGVGADGASSIDSIDTGRIKEKLQHCNRMDYFEILGVSHGATSYEVEKAYDLHSRDFEPGRFSEQIRRDYHNELQDIQDILRDAKQVLKNEHLRDAYAGNLSRRMVAP